MWHYFCLSLIVEIVKFRLMVQLPKPRPLVRGTNAFCVHIFNNCCQFSTSDMSVGSWMIYFSSFLAFMYHLRNKTMVKYFAHAHMMYTRYCSELQYFPRVLTCMICERIAYSNCTYESNCLQRFLFNSILARHPTLHNFHAQLGEN